MIQAVQKIETNIKERREVDVPLMNWWLYVFVVNPVTFGIYGLFLFFKKTGRVDKFIIRKKDYYQNILDYTEKYAQSKNCYDAIKNDLNELRESVSNPYPKKIKAGISFLLIIITFGLWAFVYLYKMNKIWYVLQKIEEDFNDKISRIWNKVELIKFPISFKVDSSKNRSYALYIFLMIITLGIWGVIWDYKTHTDPDNLYKEFHSGEDTALHTVRQSI